MTVDGTLPVNATAVWWRVLELRGVDPATVDPPTVVVADRGTSRAGTELPFVPDEFARRVGVAEVPAGEATLTWAASGRVDHDLVTLDPNGADPAVVEAVFVHEYEHVLQMQRLGGHRRLPMGVSEGAAVYVADAYAHRYLDGLDPSARRRATYEGTPANAAKYVHAFVYFGHRYVDRRVDDPSELPRVYGDPPTDEQLLYGPAADGERAPLDVRTAGDGWRRPAVPPGFAAWWRPPATVGPVFTRVLLKEHLNESAAARAASGFGNGTLLAYEGDDGTGDDGDAGGDGEPGDDGPPGYVWVVRMDDRQNATALAAALRRHLDAVADRTDDGDWLGDATAFRLVRADDETLALAVGDPAFVGNATATATGGTVTVSTGG